MPPEKAPAVENSYLIQFGEEVSGELPLMLPTQDYVNALLLDQCRFILHATNTILGERRPRFCSDQLYRADRAEYQRYLDAPNHQLGL